MSTFLIMHPYCQYHCASFAFRLPEPGEIRWMKKYSPNRHRRGYRILSGIWRKGFYHARKIFSAPPQFLNKLANRSDDISGKVVMCDNRDEARRAEITQGWDADESCIQQPPDRVEPKEL